MLEIDALTLHYGRIVALEDVSLTVRAGEAVAVLGPNGARKSTLLMTIAGALPVTSGRIEFEGCSILSQRPDRIVRLGISLVPEGRRIFGKLTVHENLLLGATVQPRGAVLRKELERVLELFPALGELRTATASNLSGGEQQQLAIARALLARPKLLLLDEPSLGLAPIVTDRVFDALETLRADGMTLLLVEQNAHRAIEIADRVYVLRNGRVQFSGTRDAVLADDRFEAAYLGALPSIEA
jgi:branched-chain amino acid transport system ATP-binding protein